MGVGATSTMVANAVGTGVELGAGIAVGVGRSTPAAGVEVEERVVTSRTDRLGRTRVVATKTIAPMATKTKAIAQDWIALVAAVSRSSVNRARLCSRRAVRARTT